MQRQYLAQRLSADTPAPQQQRRYCANCYDDIPPHRWPKESTTSNCKHPNQTCKDCWKSWLLCQLHHYTFDSVSCISCRTMLTQQDVRTFAGVQVHADYLDRAAQSALSTTPDFHWCLNAKCSSGQIHFGSHGFECGVCKHRHCTLCKLPWTIAHRRHCESCGGPEHEGKTCDEGATTHSADEKATKEAMKEMAKECPGCERKIEKEDDGGCDWMSCAKCQHEFCWICLASHKEIKSKGNDAHDKECKYYSVGGPLAYPFTNH